MFDSSNAEMLLVLTLLINIRALTKTYLRAHTYTHTHAHPHTNIQSYNISYKHTLYQSHGNNRYYEAENSDEFDITN
jgi:hypothetical protein